MAGMYALSFYFELWKIRSTHVRGITFLVWTEKVLLLVWRSINTEATLWAKHDIQEFSFGKLLAFWRILETEKRNERLFGRSTYWPACTAYALSVTVECRVSTTLAIVSLRFKLKMSKKMLPTASEVNYNVIIKNAVDICPVTGKGLKNFKYPAFRLKFSRISAPYSIFT